MHLNGGNIVTGVDWVYRLEKSKSVGRDVHVPAVAHQPQRDYESQTRSLRIDGHSTSIRLEMAFWDTLEEIASKQDMSLAKIPFMPAQRGSRSLRRSA